MSTHPEHRNSGGTRVFSYSLYSSMPTDPHSSKATPTSTGPQLFFYLVSFMIFFIRYFLYLHFKFYPLSPFLLQKSPYSTTPYPSLLTYPLLLPCSDIPLHYGIELSQEQGPIFSLMSHKAILCYICNWSHESHHVYSLVDGLVPGCSEGTG